jgi:hypothetical protein
MTAVRETRADDLDRTHRLDAEINKIMLELQESGGPGWWPHDTFLDNEHEWINTIVWGLRLGMGRKYRMPPGHDFPLAT